ncbi:MAG: SurA N-terminal domain-containing protein [Clostridiaceae bacterium]|nr:SurA N-terminal domain-containing protein [Clostridiaceae bacterium]
MNSAKKIMTQQEQDTKKKPVSVPAKKMSFGGSGDDGSSKKAFILIALCVVVIVAISISVGKKYFQPQVVATVGETDITMDDMMYPIYEIESEYQQWDELYQMYYGTSVWDATYQGSNSSAAAAGATNAVGLKQEVIDQEIEYELLYQKATEAGYSLDDEDNAEIEEEVADALKGLSWLQKFQLNISESKLTERFEKRTLAEKYKEDKQEELNQEVDEDAAIEDISKKDYRQYDIQYYYASTTSTDDDGNSVDLTTKEKKALAAKMKALAKKAKSAKNFKKLLDDSEEDITLTDDESFTEQDGWSMVSNKYVKQIKKMKNGEISEAIIDDKTGYYVVVKMIDNNSTEAYDEACETAITEAQDEKYNDWFADEQTAIGVTLDDSWNDVTLGTVTTDIVTLEDLQEMEEDSSDASSAE